MIRTYTAIVISAALMLPVTASAGGYIVGEIDSQISGRGGAATALQGTASAVFFNPANLTSIEGFQARIGISAIFPRWRFEATTPGQKNAKTINNGSTPPNFSAAYKLGNLGFGDLAAGVGVYVPYGASFKWPANWAGRQDLQEIGLQIWEISPVLALRPSEMFSIGVGLRVLPGKVYLRQAIPLGAGTGYDGSVELSGAGTAVSWSAGVSIWGFENLSLGLSWRAPAILKVSGQSDVDLPPPYDTLARDRDVRARINLPQVLRLGAVYDIIPDVLNVSADIELQQWSVFKQLKFVLTDPTDGSEEKVVQTRNAQDSITFHLGGEYEIFDGLAVRAGYVYDEKILPEETVNPAPPDSDRHVITAGVSYVLDDWLGFHMHYAHVFFVRRTSTTAPFPGTWEGGHGAATMAFVAGLSISASFDLAPVFTHKADPAQTQPSAASVVEDEAPESPTPDTTQPQPSALDIVEDEAPEPLTPDTTQTQPSAPTTEGQ